MATLTWKGVSGDWTQAADWSTGATPGAADSASITGANPFTLTLYTAAAVGNVTMNAAGALFYDAGALTLGGTFALQAGTLALAFGSLNGGTLALTGGTLAAEGGMLNGVAVDGAIGLTQANAELIVQNGLAMAGAGGSGAGSITLTGSYATLDFLGTQTLANAVVTFGATGAGQNQGGAATLQADHSAGATSGATLTVARNVWLKDTGTQGQIITGGTLPSAFNDTIVNQGTITAATQGATLTIDGTGTFTNQGTIAVSNGATLDIASAGFANTGSLVVSNATLDFGGTFASGLLGSLGALSLSQATVEIGGDAINTGGTLSIGASSALGPLALAGTITGGTVLDAGGGLNLASGTGELSGVTYDGTLALGAGAAITLLNNTVLASTGGAQGTATITGANAALFLQGQTTLDHATIGIGSASGTAELGTNDAWLAASATTATLGAHLAVQQTGKFAAIDANATTPFAGYGLVDTMVNQGTITGGFAGGTLAIGGNGIFINQAAINVSNGDTLLVAPSLFSNTGTIAITGGATAVLGGPANIFGQAPGWSNTGLIEVSGGTLDLSGALRTGQLGHITETGGAITLAGTLINTGATLGLGSGATLPALTLTGTIQGGAISDPGGLLTAAGPAAVLDGVTDTGTLALQANAMLRIRDGLTVNGQANVTASGADLAFQGSQVFSQGAVLLGAAGTAATIDVLHDFTTSAASTLTLGSSVRITQGGALADLGAATDVAGDLILNQGSITAATAGGLFTIGGAGFANHGTISVSNGDTLAITSTSFTNAGALSVTNAALDIADSVTLAQLGTVQLSNAAVTLGGTLNAAGGTLAIGAGNAWGRATLTGAIDGGTILDAGQGLAAAGSATLSDVTYRGVLDLSRPFEQLAIANGITLTDSTGTQPGTVLITGADSRVLATTSETLANATIYLGSAATEYDGQHIPAAELAATADTTLTLAASTMLRSAGLTATLGDCGLGGWSDSVVNDGTILEATPGGTLTLGSSFFTNAAGLVIGDGGNAVFDGVSFNNTGTISITAGSTLGLSLWGYYAAPNAGATVFSNAGAIRLLGGAVTESTGGGLFPAIPLLNTGLIQGFGTVSGPVLNTGTIEAKYGPNLDITGTITGAGTLQIDPGCVLEVGGIVAPTQTVDFTSSSETLRLDQSQTFQGTINGFVSGDAIDIAGTPVNTVAISAGTLVLGTGYGQFKLAESAPLGGVVSVGADAHGGKLVTYTAQTKGSGGTGGGTITVIPVNQPKMLFWASPLGDEFQGTAAQMNGAQIANWGTADSLDFVDILGTKTTVLYAQATGQGTITVTDGTHTSVVGLLGSYNATWFHVSTDPHGGAIITYSAT